jgi:uncharacterized membrane protein
VLLPAWTTFLILAALFETLDSFLLNLIGRQIQPYAPGLGLLLLIGMVLTVGAIATQVIGQRVVRWTEAVLDRIPLIRSIYMTLKGMTDLLNYRARFGQSTVVAFPFPRDGLWALGFVMGSPPAALQIAPMVELVMVFVPTAIHPFTGYLAYDSQDTIAPAEPVAGRGIEVGVFSGTLSPLIRLADVAGT